MRKGSIVWMYEEDRYMWRVKGGAEVDRANLTLGEEEEEEDVMRGI